MAGRRNERAALVGVRVGLPVASAVVLAVAVGVVFPADGLTRWMLRPGTVAGLCWAGQFWLAGRTLDVSRFIGSPYGHVFGLANTLTLVRGGLYAVVAGFVVVPATTTLAWVPALCYGVGVVLDKVDGVVARSVGEETDLGRRLDMAADSFGFVAAPLVAVLWGQLPVWYLAISAARYVYLGGIRYRRRRGRPVYDRPDSDLGKYLAGVQMAFITVALVPAAPTGLVFAVAPAVLAPSLAVFARDFCYASGRLPR